jgi:hypothetical protein
VQIGKQLTGFEEPDVIYLKLAGIVTDEEAKAMSALHLDFCQGRDRVFFLVDMSELETIPNLARKATIDALRQMPMHGLSVYQAPLTARVLAKLIAAALRLFGKGMPLQFSDSEAEARAWIEQQRQAPAS